MPVEGDETLHNLMAVEHECSREGRLIFQCFLFLLPRAKQDSHESSGYLEAGDVGGVFHNFGEKLY